MTALGPCTYDEEGELRLPSYSQVVHQRLFDLSTDTDFTLHRGYTHMLRLKIDGRSKERLLKRLDKAMMTFYQTVYSTSGAYRELATEQSIHKVGRGKYRLTKDMVYAIEGPPVPLPV